MLNLKSQQDKSLIEINKLQDSLAISDKAKRDMNARMDNLMASFEESKALLTNEKKSVIQLTEDNQVV